jgi:Mn2+/Fe2+ NRAMP family transporter
MTDAQPPAPASAPPRQRRPHRGQPHPLRDLGRWLRVLGPGLITGAADDDPAGIATYSQTGSSFGFGQLWLALYMLPLMIAVQEMCGRIGLVTGRGIAGVVRKHYRREVLLGAVALVLVANTINVGADLGAMAASAQLLVPGLPLSLLVILFAGVALLLEVFIPYRQYAPILKILTLSLLAYVITGIIIAPDWRTVLYRTLVPDLRLDAGFLLLVVAVLGTTISPYLFFWQASEEVEEEILHNHQPPSPGHGGGFLLRDLRTLRIDTVLGMCASEVATFFIIVTTAGTLHLATGSKTITTADQAASALAPLVHTFSNAGVIAQAIFALGIIGTGLLAVPILAGSAAYGVAEALGWREGLYRPLRQARGFYGVIIAATLVGLLLNVFGVNPIQALVYSAVVNGIAAVPLLVLILLVANNRAIMGAHTNGRLSNSVSILTTVAMAVAAVATVASLWWH